MLFLGFLSDWLSSAQEGIEAAIIKGIRSLAYSLDTFIYKLIVNLYNVFESLCSSRLLSSDLLETIAQRIGLILGLIMAFYVIFGFVQMLLDPDKINDKENGAGAIVKKVIIVIIMFGLSSFVFDSLFYVQKFVIQNHVISKVIIPFDIELTINGQAATDEEANNYFNEKFGAILSVQLLSTFYQLEDMVSTDTNYTVCQQTIASLKNEIVNYNRYDLGYECLNTYATGVLRIEEDTNSNAVEMFVVNFDWLMSVICGVFVAYMMFMYCFKVGVRMIQLAVLEVISPMAFVGYLSPKKDNMFEKWKNIYISTYIDVFIRMAIINFVFFIIMALFSETSDKWWELSTYMETTDSSWIITIVMIFALLTFAHKAPDLIKELFPSGGGSKLGFGASMKEIVGLPTAAKVGASALGGAIGGTASGAIGLISGGGLGSALSGIKGGVTSGLRREGFGKSVAGSWKAGKDYTARERNRRAQGGTFLGSRIAGFQRRTGMETAADRDETYVQELQEYIKMQDEIENVAKNYKEVKALERSYEAIKQAGRLDGENDDHYTARLEVARQNWKRSMQATIDGSVSRTEQGIYKEAKLESYTDSSGETHWRVGDGETRTIYKNDLGDTANTIKSQFDKLNRAEDGLGYNRSQDYNGMDTRNNEAQGQLTQFTSSRQYSRNRANAQGGSGGHK